MIAKLGAAGVIIVGLALATIVARAGLDLLLVGGAVGVAYWLGRSRKDPV
jgi:hypothetical protein